MEKEKTKSIFNKFTHQYSLSRALRFELKPLPATRDFLKIDKEEKEKIFPKDKERAKNYISLKYYLNLLHKDFINKSLSEFKKDGQSINFDEVYNNLKNEANDENENIENENEDSDKKKNDFEKLRSVIAESFKGNGFLFEKEVINRLEDKFKQKGEKIFIINNTSKELLNDKDAPRILFTNIENKEETIFQNFKGFVGYLRGFFENRKNLYKDKGKAGSVATRIIDQNLSRFFENIDKLKSILEKHSTLETNFGNNKLWKEYFEEKKLNNESNIRLFASNNYGWKKVFKPNYYNFCFLQNDIEFYNYVIRKLNKDINEYKHQLTFAQKEKKKKKNSNSKKQENKLPLFVKLHKQILGEIKKKSDFIEVTKPTIKNVLDSFIKHSDEKRALSEKIIIGNFIKKEDVNGIYVSNRAINTISNRWFSSWDFFGGKILEKENEGKPESKKRKKISDFVSITILKEVLGGINNSSEEIFKKSYLDGIEHGDTWQTFLRIWGKEWHEMTKGDKGYDKSKEKLLAEIKKISKKEGEPITQEQKRIIKEFADASLSLYQMTKYFALLKGAKEIQKEDKDDDFYSLVDAYLFGGEFEGREYEENHIYEYYNAFRNFLTKKEWSEEKIKLNFDCGHLLGGWSKNKERDNLGIILRDNDKYYLGIINNVSLLKNKSLYNNDNFDCYEKMEMLSLKWKTLTGKAYKRDFGDKYSNHVFDFKINQYKKYLLDNNLAISDLDKWIGIENEKKDKDNEFPDDRKIIDKIIKFFNDENYSNIKTEELKKLKDEPCVYAVKNLQKLIKKQFKKDYPILKKFLDRKFKTRAEFEEYKEKYGKEIYSVNFDKKIKKGTLDRFIEAENGEEPSLYLFQICNKDFQLDERLSNGKERKIEGSEDAETRLFKMLFDPQNLKNEKGVILTLNGGAEVFFRESSLEKKEEQRNFKRKIERKKRYTENKIFLHIPYTLNFGKRAGQNFPINDLFNKEILQNQDISEKVKIIGIDRGENNLAYYSVIDQKGNILEQGTLNRIYGKKKDGRLIERAEKRIVFDKEARKYVLKPTGKKINYTDYLVLLECKEKNRLLERKSWDTIEGIKDLKRGYISYVIHKISDLVFKYLEQDGVPPIIVFEKLNVGFKQGRQKIERQTYQDLELKLAKKLSYLTRKDRNENTVGGILNALQFAPEVKNFGTDIEKKYQLGIIFYVDPSYTSTTCPNCGFRKRINKTAFESVTKTIKKFEEHNIQIHFENGKYKFAFTGQQSDINDKIHNFTDYAYSDVERIYRKPKENGKGWTADVFKNMTEKLDELFNDRIDKNKEIFSQIKEIKDKEDREFWRKLMWYFNLILQIRNSSNKKYSLNEKTKEVNEEGFSRDFINCPHCHFHSDREKTWGLFDDYFNKSIRKIAVDRGEEVFSGDANGAYNIARKGILAIDRVRNYPKIREEFLVRNNITDDELNEKFGKGKIQYEVIKGKGKNKEIIDSISKYPNLLVDNIEWDKFAQGQCKEKK